MAAGGFPRAVIDGDMTGARPNGEAVFLYTTWPDADSAAAAGAAIVGDRLAACVNILPAMRSIYRWKGAVETADEAVMIVKTLRSRVDAAIIAMKALHPYETPAIVVMPLAGGSQTYLDWIAAESWPDGPADEH